MKNKKLKIFIILILIVQLLIPAYLLYHHYSLYNTALKESPDFKFRLEHISIYRTTNYTTNPGDRLAFDIENVYDYYQDDASVTVGDDGFARMNPAEDKRLNKYWFSFKYYSGMNFFAEDEYEYEAGVNVMALEHAIRTKYSKDIEKDEVFYVTAKVYKGAFIPTAIYVEGEKVITIYSES